MDNPDKLTDWVAVLISSVVALTTWAIIVHQYVTTGELDSTLMAVGGLFILLSAITLFGVEKINKALELR